MDLKSIQAIHTGPFKLVYVSSGGGSTAISDFLKVPAQATQFLNPISLTPENQWMNISESDRAIIVDCKPRLIWQ